MQCCGRSVYTVQGDFDGNGLADFKIDIFYTNVFLPRPKAFDFYL